MCLLTLPDVMFGLRIWFSPVVGLLKALVGGFSMHTGHRKRLEFGALR